MIKEHTLTIWRHIGVWMDKDGKVRRKTEKVKTNDFVTHEVHLDGKTLKGATKDLSHPGRDCVVIYKKYSKWRMLHGEDEYQIITWSCPQVDHSGPRGNTPITRHFHSRMVLFLRKLKRRKGK